jgi:uncharacterized membrane protein YkvI
MADCAAPGRACPRPPHQAILKCFASARIARNAAMNYRDKPSKKGQIIDVPHIIALLISAIQFLFLLIMGGVGVVDAAFVEIMTSFGIDPALQVFILFFVAILVVLGTIKTLGPVMSVIVLLLLILLILHHAVPEFDLSLPLPPPPPVPVYHS